MALLLLMLTLTVGTAGVLLSGRAPPARAGAQTLPQTQLDLARAVEAVIAYHLADEDNPGAVVCPDYHDSGTPGEADVSCITSNDPWFLGRLPWRTLDLPREYGRLWYAIDGDFHDDHNYEESTGGSGGGDGESDGESAGSGTSPDPLNPGVGGSLSLDGESGHAAIIFDPGKARSGQTGRPSYDVTDYLDSDNANQDVSDPTPAFIDCHGMTDCNDRARGIGVDELFATVQLRVIGELEPLFEAYYGNLGELPRAAPLGSTDCDPNTFIGHVPTGPGSCNADEYIDSDSLPSWVTENDWLEYIVYVADEGCTHGQSGCGALRVNGVDGVRGILFGAGPPLAGQQPRTTDVETYLELAENTDGDNDYLTSPVTHETNDVIRWR